MGTEVAAKKASSVPLYISVVVIILALGIVSTTMVLIAFWLANLTRSSSQLPPTPLRAMPYPYTADEWRSETDHAFDPFDPPSSELVNMTAHPARTPRRWLAAYAQGFWAPKYVRYIPAPHPAVFGCVDDIDADNDDTVRMQWYNSSQACDILSRFANVRFIGDSYVRHVWTALLHIITGNFVDGQLSATSIDTEIARAGSCSGDLAFSERECRTLIAMDTSEMPVRPCRHFKLNASYTNVYLSKDEVYDNWPRLQPPNATTIGSVFIVGMGLHDLWTFPDKAPMQTIEWYRNFHTRLHAEAERTQQAIYPLMLGYHNVIISGKSTLHYSGSISGQWSPLQSGIQKRLKQINRHIKQPRCATYDELSVNAETPIIPDVPTDWGWDHATSRVQKWSIVDNVHATTALPFDFSYDGHHYKQNVNLVKAQAILKLVTNAQST